MAVATVAKTTVVSNNRQQTPYQLNPDQTLKASRALLQHLQAETKRLQQASAKLNLLTTDISDSDDQENQAEESPVWLTLTTKQHIVDQNRLKPSKIVVPHSLNKSSDLRICLITADPQRAVKNVVADPAFPEHLKSRITRIIGYAKLKARYKTYEQLRELLSEHDIFLADDRIILRLPKTLGKVFYKGTSKRPIPIRVANSKQKKKDDQKKSKDNNSATASSPSTLAKEIEKAIGAVPVSLRPGTLVAVRAGGTSFKPDQLSENVEAVVKALIEKHVVKGWRNVRAIHIKGQNSFSVPIWLADELWTDGGDVMANSEEGQEQENVQQGQKRKRNPATTKGPQMGARKRTKVEEEKSKDAVSDRQAGQARKSKLAAQKAQVFEADV